MRYFAQFDDSGFLQFKFPDMPQYFSMIDSAVEISKATFDAMMIDGTVNWVRHVDGTIDKFDPQLSVDDLRIAKRANISNMCGAEICSGFVSDVLGANHTYPTAPQDQSNLSAVFSASSFFGAAGEPYRFWCADETGAWARRNHTADQIQVVAVGVLNKIKLAQDRYEERLSELAAADSAEAIQAVVW